MAKPTTVILNFVCVASIALIWRTAAELDENEAELTKLRSWLTKIRERDWFDATLSASAEEALKQCAQDFQRFSEEVYAAQGV